MPRLMHWRLRTTTNKNVALPISSLRLKVGRLGRGPLAGSEVGEKGDRDWLSPIMALLSLILSDSVPNNKRGNVINTC